MSVIVQDMIEADYSGICFTVDPTNGIDSQIVIETGNGTGEKIVAGKSDVSRYVYDWYKDIIIVCGKEFDEKTLRSFSKTFVEIQKFFGYPCDIEFAVKNGELFIIKARKITKINYEAFDRIWTTADFKDGISATICKRYMFNPQIIKKSELYETEEG